MGKTPWSDQLHISSADMLPPYNILPYIWLL